jgi:hypothetical protein
MGGVAGVRFPFIDGPLPRRDSLPHWSGRRLDNSSALYAQNSSHVFWL